MRPFEVLLILFLVLAALLQIRKSGRRLRLVAAVAAAATLAAHLAWEGGHYQMLPAYLAVLVAVTIEAVPLVRPSGRGGKKGPFTAALIALLCVASLGMAYVFPMFRLPKPTGPYPVGTRIFYLTDEGRHEDASSDPNAKRELAVQIWYPAAPNKNHFAPYHQWAETKLYNSYESVLWTNSRMDAPIAEQGGPFPVLLFNHGWNGRRAQDTFLTEDLASHGYVVASIDHPYNSARVALPGGRVIDGLRGSIVMNFSTSTPQAVRRVWGTEVDKWTADTLFVLNTLEAANRDPRGPWNGQLNTGLAGAVGHSFGGSVSFQACGADPRIRSAVNMDGWTFEALQGWTLGKQAMFMYGEDSELHPERMLSSDTGTRVEATLDMGDFASISQTLTRYGGYRLFVAGTSHLDFTDLPLTSPLRRFNGAGDAPRTQVETTVRDYVLAFFEKTLRGKDSPLLSAGNAGPFHDVKFESWAPQANMGSFRQVKDQGER